MQNLEARLKCKLFDRLGRTILPTPEAELLFPKAMAILEDLQNLEDEISESRKSVSGELVCSASTIPGTYLLPAMAAAFKKKYQEISFEIGINGSAHVVQEVAANKVHLGFVGATLNESKVKFLEFAEDELILATSEKSNYALTINLSELANLPFIMREKGSGTRKSMETLLTQHQFNTKLLSICAVLGSSAAVKEAILADLGVSIISRHAVQKELERGEIRQISVAGLDLRRHFYIVCSTKRTLPHQYQLFLQHVMGN